MNPTVRAVLMRLLVALLIGAAFAVLVSEGMYQLTQKKVDRDPQVIEIIIPDGTAANIQAGLPGPGLPEMVFTEGDTLMVVNQDTAAHQLGPIWVPPGTSGKLVLDRPNQYSMACTFSPGQMLGVDVQSRVKPSDRIQGILAVGLPTWILIWLYMVVAIPLPQNFDSSLKAV